MRLSRRDFTKRAFLAGGAAALGCAKFVPPAGPQTPPSYPGLPSPASSGADHIVVVTMENRSFDHFLGWLPNAVGQQSGLNYADGSGAMHATYALSGDYTGCPHNDPDHTYSGARITYDGGQMDGFLKATANDLFSIGYYQDAQVEIDLVTGERLFVEDLGIAIRGGIGAAFGDHQGDVQLAGGIAPLGQDFVSASAPGVEIHGADVLDGLGVVEGGLDEIDGVGVGGVAERELGGEALAGEVGAEGFDEFGVLARGLTDVDAEIGFVEAEQGGFDAVFLLEEEQVARDGVLDAVHLFGVEGIAARALLRWGRGTTGDTEDRPTRRLPGADDDGHSFLRQPTGHLHR